MALKNNWIDKTDEVDYVNARDINEIAHSVIELEGNSTNYATYEYVDNTFITKYYADVNLATKLYVDDAIQQAFANIARAEGVSF